MRTIRRLRAVLASLVTTSLIVGCGSSSTAPSTAPGAPTGVTAQSGAGQVTILWTGSSGATSYNIYWSTTTGVTPANGTKIAGATSPYVQTGLTNGTAYYYVVTGVNANGEGSASTQVSATPLALPAAPTGVTAAPGNAQVTVSWAAVSGATQYNIYWSTTTGVTPANGTKIIGATTPYVQTGLTNGTAYYYVVTALNTSGEGAASSQATATPQPAPAAPTGVTATPGNTKVTIAWSAVTGATSYNIYWSTTTGVTPANGTKIAGATSPYAQSGLTNGTAYYYVVTAVNAFGEGAASTQVTATPGMVPAAPTGVTATPGNTKATIAWTAVSGAASYNIYWSTTTGVTPANGTKIAGATSPYAQSGLTNGTTYYYVVTAVNGLGESVASSQVSTTPGTVPAAPTGVTATPGSAQVTIAWTAVAGATSYNIYWSITTGVTPANGTKIANATNPYVQTGLTNGTAYYYVVTAVDGFGEGAASAQATATPAVVTSNYATIASGGNHTCALATSPSGKAYCWGYDYNGQLGNGSTGGVNADSLPVAVSGGLTFASISAGDEHTCAIMSGGAAYCWGYDYYGQLGNNSTNSGSSHVSNVPVAVAGGLKFASISAGEAFTCGVTTAGVAYCWGSATVGLIGNGDSYTKDSTPQAVTGGTGYMAIGTGSTHACGLTTAGAAFCWGSNTVGELGNGGVGSSSTTPVGVSGSHVFTAISVGDDHTCGITAGGAAYCWGDGTTGALGNGGTSSSNVPTAVSGGLSFVTIVAGAQYTCGTVAGGAGYCWGSAGALGTTMQAQYTVPTAMAGGLSFSMISADVDAGYFGHACGITTTNFAYCWGSNREGQIGNGTVSFGDELPTLVSAHP